MPQEITPQVSATVDHSEGQMARADLYRAAKNAMKLFELVHTGQELEGWVQAKITKAADYLDSVYHYMEYQAKFGAGGTASSLEDIISDASMPAQKSEVSEEDDEQMRESMNYEQKLQALLEGAKHKAMMKKKSAKKDEKVEEGWDDMVKASKDRAKDKGTGKFDSKKTSTGTVYTRKASTFTDGGDDSDTKKAKAKSKKANEGIDNLSTGEQMARDGFTYTGNEREMIGQIAKYMRDRGDSPRHIRYYMNDDDFIGDTLSDLRSASSKNSSVRKTDEGIKDIAKKAMGAVKKAGSKALDKLGHGSDEDLIKDLQKKTGMPQTGKKPMAVKNEGKKPDFLDVDKDGDKKEPMKKAVADKKKNPFAKVKESDTRAPAKKTEREVTLPSGAKAKSTTVQGWQSQKADKSANKERKDSYKESAEVNKEVVAESADLTRLKALTKKLLG